MLMRLRQFRRRFVLATLACASALLVPHAVNAQDYPSGPVQILVAYGAGGGTDTLARLLAPSLSRILGKPVTVQNLPGGGGQVAATAVMRDGMEGLAILATNEPDLFMSTVFSRPPYKSGDLQSIMVDVVDPRIMLVKKDSDIERSRISSNGQRRSPASSRFRWRRAARRNCSQNGCSANSVCRSVPWVTKVAVPRPTRCWLAT